LIFLLEIIVGTSADERANEVTRMGVQHASGIQKKQLNRQREIGAEQLVRQQTGAAPPVSKLANILKVVDSNMPLEKRGQKEREELEEFKRQLRKSLCRIYSEQRSLPKYLSDESKRQKFVQLAEKEARTIYKLMRITMGGFRGGDWRMLFFLYFHFLKQFFSDYLIKQSHLNTTKSRTTNLFEKLSTIS
jgi:hypothetical protein